MQRLWRPFSRVLNYSSSEIIHRTITSYTGTTIHQFSFVIPHPLLPYLLSRIVRGKNSPVWHLSPPYFLSHEAEHQENLLKTAAPCNVVALLSIRSDFPGSGTSSPADQPTQLRLMAFPCLLAPLGMPNPACSGSAELREMRKDLLAHLAGTINPQSGHLTWQIYCKHTQNPVGKQVHKDFKAKLLPDQLTNVLVSFHTQDQGEQPVVRMNAYK